jgi:hypothetical protein
MTEHEAEQILSALRLLVRQRRADAPDLSDELLLRIQEEAPTLHRAQDALSLLAGTAVAPTQADLNATLVALSNVVRNLELVEDVTFVEPRTERTVSLREADVLPEASEEPEIVELREFLKEMLPREPDEFWPSAGSGED